MDLDAAALYGDRIADIYDELHDDRYDADATVEFLWKLGRDGRALELGLGTGRIALPLHQMGVEVTGIDASQAMIDRLRAKPGGDEIEVVLGDFSRLDLDRTFDLVYVVFNTFFNLTTQEAQIDCMRSAANVLNGDGLFVVEVFVPDPSMFDRHQRLAVDRVENDRVLLHAMRHDPIAQRIDLDLLLIGEGRTRIFPVESRYAYPAEIDLMARLAGLRLRDRWGGWRGEPFTSQSTSHVSVYEPR